MIICSPRKHYICNAKFMRFVERIMLGEAVVEWQDSLIAGSLKHHLGQTHGFFMVAAERHMQRHAAFRVPDIIGDPLKLQVIQIGSRIARPGSQLAGNHRAPIATLRAVVTIAQQSHQLRKMLRHENNLSRMCDREESAIIGLHCQNSRVSTRKRNNFPRSKSQKVQWFQESS